VGCILKQNAKLFVQILVQKIFFEFNFWDLFQKKSTLDPIIVDYFCTNYHLYKKISGERHE